MDQRTCRWPDCDRPVDRRGLCSRDYARAKRMGNFEDPWAHWVESRSRPPRQDEYPTACRWPGCGAEGRLVRGLCFTVHYTRAKRARDFDRPWETWKSTRPHRGAHRSCRWPECGDPPHGQGLCKLHYRRGSDLGNLIDPWTEWTTATTCTECGVEFAAVVNRNARYCSTACNLAGWKRENREHYLAYSRERARRRRAQIRQTSAEDFTEGDVRALYGDDCYLCGKAIDFDLAWPHPKSPTLDHIVPLALGGRHVLDNCAMTHWTCNNRKGVRLTGRRPQPMLQ